MALDVRSARVTVTGKLPSAVKRTSARPIETDYWWRYEGEQDTFQAVCSAGKYLQQQQSTRNAANLRHMLMYGNLETAGYVSPEMGIYHHMRSAAAARASTETRISMNLVAAATDTWAAKIGKNRPRPFFLTKGGDWKMQRKAKGLNKFIEGLFYEGKVYRVGRRCLVDSAIFDIAAMKVMEIAGRVCFERTFPGELLVDDSDGRYGTPRQLFQTTAWPRDVLLSLFANDAAKVEAIRNAPRAEDISERAFGDYVQVFEAWHLPSEPEADDGKHVIAIETCQLNDGDDERGRRQDEWTKSYFPFAFLRFSERPAGFYGQGIVERLASKQIEINRLLKSVQMQMMRKGRGRIFVHQGSKVAPSHITNGIADIVFYTGERPPVVDAGNQVAPEEVQQVQLLWNLGFEDIGLSRLSATMQKPAGLNSGQALRDFNDIESERFVLSGQDYENFYLDAGRIAIDLAKDIAERNGGNYQVRIPGKRALDFVDWKSVRLEEDCFEMKCFPTSSLPTTPAARREEIQEYINMGWIDAVEGRRLMEMPDLEASDNLLTARMEDADALIEEALDKGEAPPLDEFSDAQLVVSRGTSAYLLAKRQGAPPDALDGLRDLIDSAADMLTQESVTPPPMPGEPSLAPPPDMGPMPPEGMPPGPMPEAPQVPLQ